MTKQLMFISSVFMLMVFISCKTTKTYADHYATLRIDNIDKITFEIHSSDTIKTFVINDKEEIIDFIEDIHNSKVNGSWKGAQWDKIVLNYGDGAKTLSTNGEVFGQGSSGTFYNLNEKYKHYWKK